MNEKPEITDGDISAYLDGVLAADRVAMIEAQMASDPGLAEKIGRLREQDASLRALFAPFARGDASDLPPVTKMPGSHWPGWAVAAGFAIAFILGVGGGYGLRASADPVATGAAQIADAVWLDEAARDVFLTYVREVHHPVEVGADEREHLVGWLGNRIDKPFTAPELDALGFTLVGGRLLPVGGVPGAMLMYENGQGDRVTILLARNLGARDTAFQYSQGSGVNTLRWVDGPIAYAISAFLDRPALEDVSRAIYRHFENG